MDLLETVLRACGVGGVGGSDRTGRTLFDIQEKVPLSCLSAGRSIIAKATNTNSAQNNFAPLLLSESGAGSDPGSGSGFLPLGGLNKRVAGYRIGLNLSNSSSGMTDEYTMTEGSYEDRMQVGRKGTKPMSIPEERRKLT